VASCDLAIASDQAAFATPGVNIGLFCSTPMVALSRNVANKHAMEMLLTGEMIDANKAKEIGLVNHVVNEVDLLERTMELAALIASKSSVTVSRGKKTFYRQLDQPLKEAYKLCSEVMVNNMLENEAKEGIDAFINKRLPNWNIEDD
jgi:enoyl-CoA hydratase/carnithine racemase